MCKVEWSALEMIDIGHVQLEMKWKLHGNDMVGSFPSEQS